MALFPIPNFGNLGVGLGTGGKVLRTDKYTPPIVPTNNSTLNSIFQTLPNVAGGLLQLRAEDRVYELQKLRSIAENNIRIASARADAELRKAQGIALTAQQINERNAQQRQEREMQIQKANEPFWKKYSVGIGGGIAFLLIGFIIVQGIGGIKPKFRGGK